VLLSLPYCTYIQSHTNNLLKEYSSPTFISTYVYLLCHSGYEGFVTMVWYHIRVCDSKQLHKFKYRWLRLSKVDLNQTVSLHFNANLVYKMSLKFLGKAYAYLIVIRVGTVAWPEQVVCSVLSHHLVCYFSTK
jgi:hypothetical protein